ncbi:uncharacterized protein LOC126333320 [Schistocerca gregaria]|uniref:uncharacterized protein LOC126333320 n=1 Tax=Schistocerca gregaria TaxID=7010 RepID=UPI00211EAB5C|nr:uncharacterized protein LOC126333320 [Schistocerca gregaria]
MEICSDNMFLLNWRSIHNLWLSQTMGTASEKSCHPAYQLLSGLGIPALDQASSPQLQQPPPAASSFPSVEDEEARHAPLNDVTGGASPASSEVRATISIFHEPIPRDDANLSAYVSRKMSVDTSSDNTAPQAEPSFQNTTAHRRQPYAFPSTSSFGSYGAHGSDQSLGFSVQPRPASHNAVGDVSDNCPEYEGPTDPPMPKGNQDVPSHTDSDSELDDSDDGDGDGLGDGDTPVQPSKQGRPGSPIRRPTYTHLSDVSNDSVDDSDGKKQATASYPKPWKRIENAYVQALPLYSSLLASQLLLINDRPGTVSTAMLEECLFNILIQALPKTRLLKLLSKWQARLSDNIPNFKTEKTTFLGLHVSNATQNSVTQQFGNINVDRGQSVDREATRNKQHHRSDNNEYEMVDLTPDDEKNAAGAQEEKQQVAEKSSPLGEQQFQQNSNIQPHIEQMQPGDPPAIHSLPEDPPPMGAEACTPAVQLPAPLAQEFVLPIHLNEAGIQSAALSEEAAVALSPQSPMQLCSRQPFSHVQDCTTEEPAENRPGPVAPFAELVSGLPAELPSSSHDHPMKQFFVAEPSAVLPASVAEHPSPMESEPEPSALLPVSLPEHSPPMESEPLLGTSQSVVAPSSSQVPAQEDARKAHAGFFERRSREPWDHKGLLSFVARHAFTLPHHVWAERKEGQPRRSMRIAMKKQVNTYFPRERLS